MSYNNFAVETDADGVALVTWDMPDKSMNVFTEEVMDELEKIIDAVVAIAAPQRPSRSSASGSIGAPRS